MSDAPEPLSDREIEILRLLATGVSNKEIANALVISPNTVKVHLRRIFSKIGVASRTEATLYALRVGIVDKALVEPESEAEEPALPPAAPELPALQAAAQPVALTAAPRRPSTWMLWAGGAAVLVLLVLLILALSRPAPVLPVAPTSSPASPALTAAPLPALVRWQRLADLPEGRKGMAAVGYENYAYLIGGETPAGVTGSVLRFGLQKGVWERAADKPTPVSEIQAAMIGEKVYVPGGMQANRQPTANLEVFDPRRNRWEQKASLPAALAGYALAAYEGRLYLFGGWDGKTPVAGVYEYDPGTDQWQVRSSLTSPRVYAAAVTANGRIYLLGGFDGANALSLNQVYNPGRDAAGENPWEDRAPLPAGRAAMAGASLANLVFLAGGMPRASAQQDLLEYIPHDDRWLALDAPLAPLGMLPGGVPLAERLYVFGGEQDGIPQAFHQAYQAVYTIGIPILQDR